MIGAERVLARALADRQALLTAAAMQGDLDGYQPLDVEERLAAADERLAMDPADTPEAREEALERAYLQEVA